MQTIVTSEFRQDFQAQTARALRPGFMWFLGVIGVLTALSLFTLVSLVVVGFSGVMPGGTTIGEKLLGEVRWGTLGLVILGVLTVLDVGVYAWCWYRIVRRPMGQDKLIDFTQKYFLFRCSIDTFSSFMIGQPGFPWWMLMYHILACVFLPWSPLQALRPMASLLLANAVLVLLFREASPETRAAVMFLSIFTVLPGMGIAWFKESRAMARLRVQMLQTRYGQMRRELVDARRIHEALFPAPILDGPIRLDYRYEPMRQIGGDYLYARTAPARDERADPDHNGRAGDAGEQHGCGAFNLLLLDVTGHGIAAALTVNRLYGEVERVFAENPHVGPGEVLAALNRYVALTLANHSIYATALCVRIDIQRGELEYASGGHPPALLCTADGRLHELGSTAMVLGACSGAEFDPCVQRVRFEDGDTLLAYTDGAIESRGPSGRMLGVNGLLRVVAASRAAGGMNGACSVGEAGDSGLAARVLSAVEAFRDGPPEDDTLIVEVRRAVSDAQRGGVVGRATRSDGAQAELAPSVREDEG